MDIIANTFIVAQNQEGKMSAEGLTATPEQRTKHSECVSRGLLQSLGVASITFPISYFSQKRFTRDVKGMKRSNIIISSTVFAALSAYLTATSSMDMCNKNFRRMVSESKK